MKSLPPSLLSQIEAAQACAAPLRAFISLDIAPNVPGAATVALTNALVKRTSQATGQRPNRVGVLVHIRSITVDAPAQFIQTLLLQPQVKNASFLETVEDDGVSLSRFS